MIRTIFIGAILIGTSLHAEEKPNAAAPFGFAIDDLSGTNHRLEPEAATKVWGFVFISTECPIARSYIPALNRLAEARNTPASGVQFFGVLSDPSLNLEKAKSFAKEYGVRFPVLFDASGKLAGALGPARVPEAFVLDGQLKLAYRGRIDDLYTQIGKRRQEPTEHTLQDAIDAVLSGKPPANPRTEPVGCLFESWKDSTSRKLESAVGKNPTTSPTAPPAK